MEDTVDTNNWYQGINVAITVCDDQGVIVEMNEQAAQTFAKDGGKKLLGKSFWECHPEPARQKIRQIMEQRKTNSYTIEKNGVKKLIYQTPWYEKNFFRGLVEISMVIPLTMPHFIRK
jgi:transcriptional regulator with PAS, ATPase and Fis domain